MGFDAGENPDPIAVRVWNMMGGGIDWTALPVLVPIFGVEDVERLLLDLIVIRNHLERSRD